MRVCVLMTNKQYCANGVSVCVAVVVFVLFCFYI